MCQHGEMNIGVKLAKLSEVYSDFPTFSTKALFLAQCPIRGMALSRLSAQLHVSILPKFIYFDIVELRNKVSTTHICV